MAFCSFKLYNKDFNSIEFALLNFKQILTGRQTNFTTSKSNALKVGIYSLANRLFYINNEIPLTGLICQSTHLKLNVKN